MFFVRTVEKCGCERAGGRVSVFAKEVILLCIKHQGFT